MYTYGPVMTRLECVFVFPGSRSELLFKKLQRNPIYKQLTKENCHFLKFRQLRKIAEKADINIDLFRFLIDADPPLESPPTQLQIL